MNDTLSILHEDDYLVCVAKPAGMLAQQAYDSEEPNLHHLMIERAKARGEEVFLMQRLDRGTSGVMFFTKRSEVNSIVTRAFERKEISKTYLALVEGAVRVREVIEAPIDRIGPISFGVRPGGRKAITRVEPLVSSDQATLVRLELMTGRTHRIRVHLSAIGHPLVADWLYGTEEEDMRPMLHAWRLEMNHPKTREALEVVASLPRDFISAGKGLGIECGRIGTE